MNREAALFPCEGEELIGANALPLLVLARAKLLERLPDDMEPLGRQLELRSAQDGLELALRPKNSPRRPWVRRSLGGLGGRGLLFARRHDAVLQTFSPPNAPRLIIFLDHFGTPLGLAPLGSRSPHVH